jgi:predicted  nucleic acid-binding Zn-ribbon protein
MVIGLGVAAAVLAAFLGYELLQAKESERLLDEAYLKVATVETSRGNLESEFKKALSAKDLEIEEARADSRRLADNLAKEEEKNRILQAHADKGSAAVQAKASPAGDMDSLKSNYRQLAKGMAKLEDEVRRLSGELASRKTSSSASKPKQKPLSAAERSVVQVANGPNKGRWYFVPQDGFRSPLYGSREGALRDAKLHAARTGY